MSASLIHKPQFCQSATFTINPQGIVGKLIGSLCLARYLNTERWLHSGLAHSRGEIDPHHSETSLSQKLAKDKYTLTKEWKLFTWEHCQIIKRRSLGNFVNFLMLLNFIKCFLICCILRDFLTYPVWLNRFVCCQRNINSLCQSSHQLLCPEGQRHCSLPSHWRLVHVSWMLICTKPNQRKRFYLFI